ncbi:FMN-binding negative transcriptional regulator [Roseateles koreensis]|nr:FMN-binding negative transcriptional regulator [Roseateles koreensis]
MYNPIHFQLHDQKEIWHLIAESPLATLIGADDQGQAFVTHVPLTVQVIEQSACGVEPGTCTWSLEGHMARANPHWGWLDDQAARGVDVLAVFNGPSAYVSPKHYEHERNVPTWNYLAVHVYGRMEWVTGQDDKDALLKRLIAENEPAYADQWHELPADFKAKMLGAIVGFRLQVTRCEAKAKLSQNRSAVERARIREAFRSGSPSEQGLANWMDRLLP